MKKRVAQALGALLLAGALMGCAAQEAGPYVEPYELDESQRELLSLLGIEDEAMVFSFEAPEEAGRLSAHAYVLEDGAWVENGGVSLFREEGDEPFAGELAFTRQEDRSIDLALHSQGKVSFRSEPVAWDGELLSSGGARLTQRQPAELGREVPVAAFVEDGGTALKSLDIEKIWNEPETAAGLDIVQVVTLEFSQE